MKPGNEARNLEKSGTDSSEAKFIVTIPYFDRRALQPFCWTGEVRATGIEDARRKVHQFLRDRRWVIDQFLGYAPMEDFLGCVPYFEQWPFDIGDPEITETSRFLSSVPELLLR